jgi:hypothetical protein
MRTITRIVAGLILAVTAITASASSLTISPRHDVLITDDVKKQQLRVLFAEEPLLADVVLNVYVVEQLPSTRAHHAELQKLTQEGWLDSLKWSLVTADGREIALPRPVTLTSSVRQRGPDAVNMADRDAAVPTTTYRARLSFGSVPADDYVLHASAAGLTSRFSFVVRTGNELYLRDHYLRLKAVRTRDYAEFRKLELERLERNPARIDALYDLIDRALVEGTVEETRSYFDRAIAAAENARRTSQEPTRTKQIDSGIRQLRAARTALPQYYANKASWSMSRDTKSGHYAIRDRRSGAVVRDFAANE